MDDDAFQTVTNEGELDGYGVEEPEESDDALLLEDEVFEPDSDESFDDEL